MTQLVNVMDRLFGQPLFLHPQKAEIVAGIILSRSGFDRALALETPVDVVADAALDGPEASRFIGSRRRADGSGGLARTKDGVAVIDVIGSLVNRGAWVGAYSGLVSYEGIGAQVDAAVEGAKKGEIKGLIIDINSPGGEATGMFAAAERIRAARAYMPIVAVVNDMAASAAYGLASSANEIVISPTSLVGSIGVVFMHADRTKEKKKAGIVETAIYAGANKTLGMGTLTPEAKASFQSMVDVFYERFLETVEAGRGERTTAEAARATEASVYIGQEAIEKGLADRVGTFDEILSDLSTRPATRRAPNSKGLTMSTNANPAATADQSAAIITEAQAAARVEAARAEAKAEGIKAERTRCEAILTSDAAKGREAMAAHLAFKTDMAAADATALLETSPKAAAGSSVPPIHQRAAGLPEAGASGGQSSGTPAAENISAMWDRATARANPTVNTGR
jgi:signal peptide peptidase SppA